MIFVVVIKNWTRCLLKVAFYARCRHVCFGALAPFVARTDVINGGGVFVQITVTISTFPTPGLKNVLPKTFTG